MKRFIVALLTLMLVFTGVSCGQKKTVSVGGRLCQRAGRSVLEYEYCF